MCGCADRGPKVTDQRIQDQDEDAEAKTTVATTVEIPQAPAPELPAAEPDAADEQKPAPEDDEDRPAAELTS